MDEFTYLPFGPDMEGMALGDYLPSNPQWRAFKFRIHNGKMVKIKDRINNTDDLKDWLWIHQPKDVYYSLAWFLNPTIINKMYHNQQRQKGGPKLWENLFLGSDFLVDIDLSLFDEDPEKALDHAKTIFNFLVKKFPNNWIHRRFSGSGIHLVIEDFYINSTIENPVARELDCREKMGELTLELINEGFLFDWPCSVNTRQVLKLPNTMTSHGTRANIREKRKGDQHGYTYGGD